MKNKLLPRSLALILALLMTLSAYSLLFTLSAFAEEDKTVVITLDPGHGPQKTGTNGAVEYGGINEHFYTFSMATYAKERLEQYKGVEVHLTRTADNTPELMERPQTAADLHSDAFVSIHINAANKKAGGTEIWVPNDSWRPEIAKASRAAGSPILENIVNTFGLNNRGFKTSNSSTGATYPDGSPADKLTVIKGGKELNIPVVMLIEVAFADNKSDYEKVFATEEGLKTAGYCIADGLASYYGLKEAPKTEFLFASNDELRFLDEGGNQIGQAFAPGQFDKWESKVIEFEEGSVHSLVDWGWTAIKSEGFQYGYVINGEEELFDDAFTVEAEQAVLDAITALKGNNGSRFMGVLPTEKLKVGENTIQFIVKLDEEITAVIREYQVIVTERITEAPTEAPTEPPTEAPTEAPIEVPTEVPTAEPTTEGGCGAVLPLSALLLTAVLSGAVLTFRRND